MEPNGATRLAESGGGGGGMTSPGGGLTSPGGGMTSPAGGGMTSPAGGAEVESLVVSLYGEDDYRSTPVHVGPHTNVQNVINQAAVSLGLPEFEESRTECLSLTCVVFSTELRHFVLVKLKPQLSLLQQLDARGREVAAGGQEGGTDCTVKMLYLVRENSRTPRLGDGKVMRSLVQQFSPRFKSDCPDLCLLPDLNETTLIQHIKRRFEMRKFYTYVGTILISVNPYRRDSSLFSSESMKRYRHLHNTTTLSKDVDPHVFALGDQAFRRMRAYHENQCIVISGESGSGKTVAANEIISYLMQLTEAASNSGLENKIANTSPILEAFGNAKTEYNDNSSRHGKYIEIKYRTGGNVTGARVQQYLLEKSRIVFHSPTERNYHVFFYLLGSDFSEGASESPFKWLKTKLRLTQPNDYRYLSQTSLPVHREDDYQNFVYTVSSLHQLLSVQESPREFKPESGTLPQAVQDMFTVLAAILHLGNVTFEAGAEDDSVVQVVNKHHLESFCQLMKLPYAVVESGLQLRTNTVRRQTAQTITQHNSTRDAENARDTVAKQLYSSLFDWIITRLNYRMFSPSSASCPPRLSSTTKTEYTIGILDIFGFENFKSNGFEQFCINFANEQLQFYFNEHIFKLEQEEYTRDGLDWTAIQYTNNQPAIHLFTRRPMGLFALLDEESSIKNGTNEVLLSKFEEHHGPTSKDPCSEYFVRHPIRHGSNSTFAIKHYAGDVVYSIAEFREKNLEKSNDLLRVLPHRTRSLFVKSLLSPSPTAIAAWRLLRTWWAARCAFVQLLHRNRTERTDHPTGDDIKVFLTEPTSSHRFVRRGKNGGGGGGGASQRPVTTMNPGAARGELLGPGDGGGSTADRELSFRERAHRRLSIANVSPATMKEVMAAAAGSSGLGGKVQKQYANIRTQPLDLIRHFHAMNCQEMSAAPTSGGSRKPSGQRGRTQPTVSSQFVSSLSFLMESLNHCEPLFIRCIRSNTMKQACVFDEETVLRQLKYTGMLDTVRIRSAGYNVRETIQDFIAEYHVILPDGLNTTREGVQAFLGQVFSSHSDGYQIGNTKVYLRETEYLQLQFFIELKLSAKAQVIQRWYRRIKLAEKLSPRSKTLLAGVIDSHDSESLRLIGRATTAAAPANEDALAYSDQEEEAAAKIQRNYRKFQQQQQSSRQPHEPDSRRLRSQTEFVPPSTPGDGGKPGTKPPPPSDLGQSLQTPPPGGNSMFYTNKLATEVRNGDNNFTRGKAIAPKKEGRGSWLLSLGRKPQPDEGATTTGGQQPSLSPPAATISTRKTIGGLLSGPGLISKPEKRPPTSPESEDFVIVTEEDVVHTPRVTRLPQNRRMCRQCREKVLEDGFDGLTRFYICTDCIKYLEKQQNQYRAKRAPTQESPTTSKTQLRKLIKACTAEDPERLVLTRERDLNNFTKYLMTRMEGLGVKDDSVFFKIVGKVKSDLLHREASNAFKPYTYEDVVKFFVNNYDEYPDRERRSKEMPKPYAVRTFTGLIAAFEQEPKQKSLSQGSAPDKKPHRRKRSKVSKIREFKGHQLVPKQHSPQYQCDLCDARKIEELAVCNLCSVTIHKLCEARLTDCKKTTEVHSPSQLIGVKLEELALKHHCTVPPRLEAMLEYIEENGLEQQGLYRKAAALASKKRLINELNSDDFTADCLSEFDVTTVADGVKEFFRRMPDPLLTFHLHDNFLWAMEVPDYAERVQGVFSLIDKLSPAHHDTLQRLIVHLVRVSEKSEQNKMTVSNLAVVFSENIVRQESVVVDAQYLKQIACKHRLVELVIGEMGSKVRLTLLRINEVDLAIDSASAAAAVHQRSTGREEAAAADPEQDVVLPEKALEQPGDGGDIAPEALVAAVQHNDCHVLARQQQLLETVRTELVNQLRTLGPGTTVPPASPPAEQTDTTSKNGGGGGGGGGDQDEVISRAVSQVIEPGLAAGFRARLRCLLLSAFHESGYSMEL